MPTECLYKYSKTSMCNCVQRRHAKRSELFSAEAWQVLERNLERQRRKRIKCIKYSHSATLRWHLSDYSIVKRMYYIMHSFTKEEYTIGVGRTRRRHGVCQCFPQPDIEVNHVQIYTPCETPDIPYFNQSCRERNVPQGNTTTNHSTTHKWRTTQLYACVTTLPCILVQFFNHTPWCVTALHYSTHLPTNSIITE